jgi:hypothetical protein
LEFKKIITNQGIITMENKLARQVLDLAERRLPTPHNKELTHKTSEDGTPPHRHEYSVDANGNGYTNFVTNGVPSHVHKIVNYVVEPTQKHTHTISKKESGETVDEKALFNGSRSLGTFEDRVCRMLKNKFKGIDKISCYIKNKTSAYPEAEISMTGDIPKTIETDVKDAFADLAVSIDKRKDLTIKKKGHETIIGVPVLSW